MLAARKLPATLHFPLLASFKLDGYRALIRDDVVLSRKLKPVVNAHIQEVLGRSSLHGLDGELTVGPANAPDLIQRMGEVRREHGEPDFRFYVFDFWDSTGGFLERYHRARRVLRNLDDDRVVLLRHYPISDQYQLDALEAEALKKGYEGLIIRSHDGPYKYGRSTEREGFMLKVKRWQDDEMEITGWEEEFENTNRAEIDELGRTKRSKKKGGMVGKRRLGAWIGKDLRTGVDVRVGSGITAEQRLAWWQEKEKMLGEIVTYKHFDKTGVKDKRRFAIFRAFRDRNDL